MADKKRESRNDAALRVGRCIVDGTTSQHEQGEEYMKPMVHSGYRRAVGCTNPPYPA
ncbi:hypothetical protein KCP75_17575 [Salmonella enterica subsp. enterica]|nr:hypothetical protein KCP75_17575 [Salmonella enterica subsp. enterica]